MDEQDVAILEAIQVLESAASMARLRGYPGEANTFDITVQALLRTHPRLREEWERRGGAKAESEAD